MKPLTILHTESSLGLGGQEFRTVVEATGMIARGHRVYLAVQPQSQLKALAEQQGVPVQALCMPKTRYLGLIRDFLCLIENCRIDLVNTHGSVDSWAASLAGRLSVRKPIIVRTRHKSTPIPDSLHHRILYKWLPHGVITTAEAIREQIMRAQGLPQDRIVSIPTGVDLTRFSHFRVREDLRQVLGLPPEALVVGTVAFLRDYKGLDDFVEAATIVIQRLLDAYFVVVGDGPERDALQRRAAALGVKDRVVFTGFRQDIPAVLADLDLFVLPSVAGEGTPQALLQAMAMERPVVGNAVGGIPEVVKDGRTGLLAPPRDVRRLADRIVRLLTDGTLRKSVAQAGRQVVTESYSIERMLDKTEAFYERLMEATGAGNGKMREDR